MDYQVMHKPDDLKVANYAVAFLDLLGQRAAMQGESVLPDFTSEADYNAFILRVRRSVGSISSLYQHAESMLQGMYKRGASELRDGLAEEQLKLWDVVHGSQIKTQRWSDGLMAFSSLAEVNAPCPTVGTFDLITLSGVLCFIGLASGRPIRGGIDVAWGVELRDAELHGPAVACAYDLESTVAGYPRIAVSERMNHYLHTASALREAGDARALTASLAQRCLSMLTTDVDGVVIVDYLGRAFRDAVSESQHAQLYSKARRFVEDQLAEHIRTKNEKLLGRYRALIRYFDARGVGNGHA